MRPKFKGMMPCGQWNKLVNFEKIPWEAKFPGSPDSGWSATQVVAEKKFIVLSETCGTKVPGQKIKILGVSTLLLRITAVLQPGARKPGKLSERAGMSSIGGKTQVEWQHPPEWINLVEKVFELNQSKRLLRQMKLCLWKGQASRIDWNCWS